MKRQSEGIMNKIAILSIILAMAVGLGGCTTINPPASPTTKSAPAETAVTAPELMSPHNRATNIELTPTLLWAEVPNAKGYELWLARDYELSDIIHSVSLGGTAYQVRDGLSPSTQYYWIVAAKLNPADPDTTIAWSPVWTFTTAPALTPTSTLIPPPPEVPQEVLLIWKSPPPSGATPALSGAVTLEPNKAKPSGQTFEVISTAGSNKDSEVFYLDEGQWADILVSCSDMPIYYLSEESGAAHLVVCHWATQPDKPGEKVRSSFNADMGIFNPFYSRCLYENHITNIDKGPIFTTAVRTFAWCGAGEYFLWVTNFSGETGCQITYQVYKRGSTPGWGEGYKETKLDPWLHKLGSMWFSGEISKEEYDIAESKWLEQFE